MVYLGKMRFIMKVFILQFVGVLFFSGLLLTQAFVHRHRFVVKEAPYTRLCSTKNILTVNGKFPGPVLYANTGDTLVVDVYNQGSQNITIHWHGVKQPRYPWSDGPEFITQCPIRPGTKFSQKIKLSDEEGTLWWHAHSDWSRATVNGALVIRPANKTQYPFPKPDAEIPIIIGEWWKSDVQEVVDEFLASGGDVNISDAYLINGQPGDLYPCSRNGTYKLTVDYGKTYLLRMVNAVMNNQMFFSIANHQITVVGSDAAYLKPFKTDYIIISPGQTIDLLLEANQPLNHYYMASRAYSSNPGIRYDDTNTTAILQYRGNYTPSSPPSFPNNLPNHTDTNAFVSFTGKFRFLANKEHPMNVPLNVTKKLLFTFSVNTLPCANESCLGPNGDKFAASVNNISFVMPQIDILEAYYKQINGIYGDDFPSVPPLKFNYTGDSLPVEFQRVDRRTEVHVLEYGSTVEIVLQGTNLLGGVDHPIHLHGYSFYVVGLGFGNFDKEKDPLNYNVVDPPLQNTIAIPRNGWAAIRFTANNPGVWFMHCHFERHISWGMDMAFIVKDGKGLDQKLLPPPPDMPNC
ncbi:laccase-14-like [Nicotiana tabacum]|uniref:Laccase n=1 Tax=Nicotiana tabacum TaxID=4097 RepID=A0A1S4DKB6_TOBAC|nr:PREDICTED: laccase-14-like [Nicotiana tabacum]